MKNEKITSRFQKARNYKKKWVTIKAESKSIILIMIGIISASFGLKGFLLPNNFIDGGITGLSLLLTETTQMPLSILIIIVNIPFIILGYITLGKQFAIKTSFAIIGLGLCIAFINFPNITNDKLLVAVFGGIFLGAGIGFSIRGGAVIDGTEVLAIYLSKKWGVTIGDFIIIINIFIFGTAAIVLSIEAALYSMITYFSASKTLDFIVDGFDEYIGVTIVSSHCKEIKEMIVDEIWYIINAVPSPWGFDNSILFKIKKHIISGISNAINSASPYNHPISPLTFLNSTQITLR